MPIALGLSGLAAKSVPASAISSGVAGSGTVLTSDGAGGAAFQAAGGGGAIALLSSTVLAVAGNFDVSGISGAYNDLICVLIARGSSSNSGADVFFRFNNDSATNYQYNYLSGTASSSVQTAQGQIDINAAFADASYTADRWGAGELTVYGYASTTRTKTCVFHSHGSATTQSNYRGGGNWLSDAAITRVQCQPAAGTWVIGSELRIYGRL
jgi:hypothetical protein